MQSNQADLAEDNYLRLVFDDSVISIRLAAEATLGEIARRWDDLSSRHPHKPIAVDVIFGCSPDDRRAR
jgi:hypothetical protein